MVQELLSQAYAALEETTKVNNHLIQRRTLLDAALLFFGEADAVRKYCISSFCDPF
jgi:hypothetical protein